MTSDARKRLAETRAAADQNPALSPDYEALIECRFCPPGCKSCEPSDCECYSHQDWPDASQEDDFYASRLRLCIDAPGCDGRSHDIRCNEVLYA